MKLQPGRKNGKWNGETEEKTKRREKIHLGALFWWAIPLSLVSGPPRQPPAASGKNFIKIHTNTSTLMLILMPFSSRQSTVSNLMFTTCCIQHLLGLLTIFRFLNETRPHSWLWLDPRAGRLSLLAGKSDRSSYGSRWFFEMEKN